MDSRRKPEPNKPPQFSCQSSLRGDNSVFRAYKHEQNGYGQVAACKVVSLPDPKRSQNGKPAVDLKALQKEVSVHKSLKSKYILEYMDSLMVQHGHRDYIPGLYMLMELATHGDLFDKIGKSGKLKIGLRNALMLTTPACSTRCWSGF